MHFITLTRMIDSQPVAVNMEHVVELIDIQRGDLPGTLVLFNFPVGEDYGYEEVKETRAEILAMC